MRRQLVFVVTVGLLAVPAASYAEPTRYCKLVVDQAGDANAAHPAAPMRSTDIVSADLATPRDYITAAIRVDDLYARYDESPGTVAYGVAFDVNRSRFALQAIHSATRGYDYTVWHRVGGDDQNPEYGFIWYGTGEFNDDENTVYITTHLSALGITNSKGMAASRINVGSAWGVDALATATTISSDSATSSARYPFGGRSCSRAPVNPCKRPARTSTPPPEEPCPK